VNLDEEAFTHTTYGKSFGPVDPATVSAMRNLAEEMVINYALALDALGIDAKPRHMLLRPLTRREQHGLSKFRRKAGASRIFQEMAERAAYVYGAIPAAPNRWQIKQAKFKARVKR